LPTNSGSLAIFAAIRRASYLVSSLAAPPREASPLSFVLRLPILRFAADGNLFELASDFSSLS
jgi:hypothetical protein